MNDEVLSIGRTSKELLLWNDMKQIVREQLLAEVRDELHAWAEDLDSAEGVIPTVDEFLDATLRDPDDDAPPLQKPV